MSELLIKNGIENVHAELIRSALSLPRVRLDRECIALVYGLLDEIRSPAFNFEHP